jgi:hypothetical protein
MPEKGETRGTGSPMPSSAVRELIEAAREVVRAHRRRDLDRASDEDVSDAIADLERCLPRQRTRDVPQATAPAASRR